MGEPRHWLVKQEPEAYSWESFVREEGTAWTGVRNFQARNHLRAMKKGDEVLFYHSGDTKAAVGLARVIKEAYPDPTAAEGDWSAVDLKPVKPLRRAVSLREIKTDKVLMDMDMVRLSRISVTPVSAAQFKRLIQFSETGLP
jgi:predicted RNA-binding protein with PUA-like domain